MGTKMRNSLMMASAASIVAAATLVAGPVSAHKAPSKSDRTPPGQEKTISLRADLTELNRSGVTGTATAVVRNQKIRQIDLHAEGLSPDAPHAMHIHYGDDARNECPTMDDATNTRADGSARLSTADGLPAYGPIVVSLTASGDTTPASALALDRFPTSENGFLNYSRSNIEFTAVSGTGYTGGSGTAKQIADAIRDGEGVVVIHGVDYNDNSSYDFDGAGTSELADVPAEATDPAACGVLR